MVYKDSVGVFQGPVYDSFRIEGNKIRMKFKSTGSGLMSKDGKDLRTFEVAGEDGKYVPAKAVIEGNDVLVWSDAVKKPLSARHAGLNWQLISIIKRDCPQPLSEPIRNYKNAI